MLTYFIVSKWLITLGYGEANQNLVVIVGLMAILIFCIYYDIVAMIGIVEKIVWMIEKRKKP